MYTVFEWDERKAEINFEKHGVSFDDAIGAFADPFAILEHDRTQEGEDRWQTLGMAEENSLLLVVHTIREQDEAGSVIEILRIISARQANPKERRRYEFTNDSARGRPQ